jgi:hypothetical protein
VDSHLEAAKDAGDKNVPWIVPPVEGDIFAAAGSKFVMRCVSLATALYVQSFCDVVYLNLQAELMRPDDTDALDYLYLATMMTPAYLGYIIQHVKKVVV